MNKTSEVALKTPIMNDSQFFKINESIIISTGTQLQIYSTKTGGQISLTISNGKL